MPPGTGFGFTDDNAVFGIAYQCHNGREFTQRGNCPGGRGAGVGAGVGGGVGADVGAGVGADVGADVGAGVGTGVGGAEGGDAGAGDEPGTCAGLRAVGGTGAGVAVPPEPSGLSPVLASALLPPHPAKVLVAPAANAVKRVRN